MQMGNRQYVAGTEPAVYIGRRIYRKKDGSRVPCATWHAEYCANGQQYSKSLATRNVSAAIRAAHALCQRLRDGVERATPQRLSVTDLKAKYLEVLANRGRSPLTLGKYKFVLTEFAEWWHRHSGRPAAKLVEADLWAYRAFLEKEEKSAKSICDRLTIVKQLFKWGAGKGKLIPLDPLADTSVFEPPPTSQPCFSPQQVEKLLEAAKPHERNAFVAMAYTGMRVGEVVALTWEDVLLDRGRYGFIHVRRGGSNGMTKGKRARLIPIHPKLRVLLDQLPRHAETVFTRPCSARCPSGDRPLNPRQLLGAVKRLSRKCGFSDWERYKVHTFRHAFASMCARSHTSVKYALNWMGHRRSDILDLYISMCDDAAESAIAQIQYTSPSSPPTGTPQAQAAAVSPADTP